MRRQIARRTVALVVLLTAIATAAPSASAADTTPPTAPTGLRVTSTTKTSLGFAWNASTDASGIDYYNVHLDGANDGAVTSASHTYTGLSCGRSYRLSVRAFDNAGNPGPVAQITAATSSCTDTTSPTPPTNLRVTARTTSSITVAWNAATDNVAVDRYHVHRNQQTVGNTTGTTWIFAGLACATSYSFSVRAFDAADNFSPASALTASTTACSGPTPQVTVTVDRSVQTGTSLLTLGATHGHHSADWWGEDAAVGRARTLLSSSVKYQGQHIYGWGAENPQPRKGVFDWQSLDNRVALMRETGATPVIMLCCAPDWMTSAGTNTSDYPLLPPTTAHYGDFVALVRTIAQRYPDVRHFVFWNQMKGWWSSSLNNWNYVQYTQLYNLVYDELKRINPANKVGGLYLAIDGTGDPLSERNEQLIDYWLANRHGADFWAFTYAVVPWVSPQMPSPAQIMSKTGTIAKVTQQLRAKSTLPLWFVEDYFDGDFTRVGYASHAYQAAAMGSILLHEVRSGVSASFRFQPEGNADRAYLGNQESLWSETSGAGGGQPFPLAAVYQNLKSRFPAGTKLYKTTSSSADVEVLASASSTMLVNKRPSTFTVSVNGTAITLAAYEVRFL